MLTGLYPNQHGVFHGVKRSKKRDTATTDRLADSIPTLASVFSSAGWRCGAFINNAQLGEFSGLGRGFETYVPNAGKADRLIGMFSDWMHADQNQPGFAYLHFLESHWPYKPRRRHVAMFGGNRDQNCFRDHSARDFGKLRRSISRGDAELSANELTQLCQLYDGSVRRLDGKIKIIQKMLDDLGVREETAILVTADHGEEFMEHDRIGHGHSLYDELTHVPLVAQIPSLEGGDRRRDPVSLTDLPCTLLDIAGLPQSLPGRSLVAQCATDTPVFSELWIRHRYIQTVRVAQWKLHRERKAEQRSGNAMESIPIQEWLTSTPVLETETLFDIEADPHETKNCINEAKRQGDSLRDVLNRWWEKCGTLNASQTDSQTEIDNEVVLRLRSLGYLD